MCQVLRRICRDRTFEAQDAQREASEAEFTINLEDLERLRVPPEAQGGGARAGARKGVDAAGGNPGASAKRDSRSAAPAAGRRVAAHRTSTLMSMAELDVGPSRARSGGTTLGREAAAATSGRVRSVASGDAELRGAGAAGRGAGGMGTGRTKVDLGRGAGAGRGATGRGRGSAAHAVGLIPSGGAARGAGRRPKG